MIIDGDYHDNDLGERVLTVASLTRALMMVVASMVGPWLVRTMIMVSITMSAVASWWGHDDGLNAEAVTIASPVNAVTMASVSSAMTMGSVESAMAMASTVTATVP